MKMNDMKSRDSMDKKVCVSRGVQGELQKIFGCTGVMVWKALTYKSDTELARKIRKQALDRGGKVVCTLPECETIHDSGCIMRQTFANGAVLEVDKSDGSGTVWHDGRKKVHLKNMTVMELYMIQACAANL